ncbi:MAG TPA: NUDIX domain-containing protein [Acidimicrobiales bacterium]|nr:NUDIX domain-containing protein [Acidimicrobiales bacterium]
MSARLQRALLMLFRRLPPFARRRIVRTITPSFTVGAICLIERYDGKILLVRQVYRNAWGVPGGLSKRGEDIADCARREVLEEVGVPIDLVGEPAVVVDAAPRRVDVVFRARPSAVADLADVAPRSPEIRDVRWFALDELPELQHEAVSALAALTRASAQARLDLPIDTLRRPASSAG